MSLNNINAFCKTLSNSNWDAIHDANDATAAYAFFYSKVTAMAEISF